MEKQLVLFMVIAMSAINPLFAQVGINTETPQAVLDINGDLMIRTVPVDNTSSSLLVLDANNVVHQNTAFLAATPKSFVAGTGVEDTGLVNIALLDTWHKIRFETDLEADDGFDENSDYNTTTSEFTASRAGIYLIYAQMETTGLIGAGEVGLAIVKKPVGQPYRVIAQESYVNVSISVLGIGLVGVSPPTRRVQRLVKLNVGDIITFAAKVPVLSTTLVGGSKSFFTIQQVK